LPSADTIAPLVRAIEAAEIRVEATEQILDALLRKGEDDSAEDVLARYRRNDRDLEDLVEALDEVANDAAGMPGRSLETLERWGMGMLMRRFLGKLDPKLVSERVRSTLNEAVKGQVA
jgi:Glu-tRNA(Gln) amidotransferase subunit E-like FAD-binding protein